MAELGEVKRKIAEYEAKGNIEKAIAELGKAVQDFPREGSLLNKLGDLYIRAERRDDALETYEKGARIFKEETYYPNAIALCKKTLRLDKDRTEIYGLLGELHKELDQRGEAANYLLEYAERKIKGNELEVALNTYTTIKELVPNNAKILQTISAIYEQMGKKEEAGEFLKEAQKIESEQGKLKETLTTKGAPPKVEEKPVKKHKVVEVETAKEAEALVAEEIKAKEEPVVEEVKVKEEPVVEEVKTKEEPVVEETKKTEDVTVETKEAEESIEEPRVEEAEKTKEKISLEEFVSPEVAELLRDDDKNVSDESIAVEEKEPAELSEIERTIELGELYLNLGSEDEAIDCFRNAACEAVKTKDYEKATDLNTKIAELRPFDLKSRQYLIEIAKAQGNQELQIDAMLELAEALNRRDAKSEAQSLYKKIVKVDPDNARAKEMLAASEHPKDFIDLGEVLRTELEEEQKVRGVQTIDELISEFRREVFESIGEGDYHSHYDLGVAYKGMGLFQEAVEEFEIAAKDESLKLKAIEMIGSCFLERDKIEDALRVLNSGLQVSNRPTKEYFGLHFLIGKCYEKDKKLTQALKVYMKAYNIDKKVPDLIKKINLLKRTLTTQLEKRNKKTRLRKSEKVKPRPAKIRKKLSKKSKITYL